MAVEYVDDHLPSREVGSCFSYESGTGTCPCVVLVAADMSHLVNVGNSCWTMEVTGPSCVDSRVPS